MLYLVGDLPAYGEHVHIELVIHINSHTVHGTYNIEILMLVPFYVLDEVISLEIWK